MKWTQHGDYSLHWHGDVLIARYCGLWNEVAAQHLHRDALQLWQARDPGPWALLSDGSQWEGGTAQCLEEWWQFFEDGVHHGMVAVTDILPTHFHAMMVSPLAQRASQLATYKCSDNLDEALQWLSSQPGIKVPSTPPTVV